MYYRNLPIRSRYFVNDVYVESAFIAVLVTGELISQHFSHFAYTSADRVLPLGSGRLLSDQMRERVWGSERAARLAKGREWGEPRER